MHPLDQPILSALTSLQSHMALVHGKARRFPPEVTVLGALDTHSPQALQDMAHLATKDPVTLYFPSPPQLPPEWHLVRSVELELMVYEDQTASPIPARSSEVIDLTTADLPQMVALYASTRPGRSLSPRLIELGGFVGVRTKDKLVSMACMRLHLPGHREISTVGTLPECEGRGHAAAVVSELVRRIRSANETPFLTVRSDNARAAALYRRLGFVPRNGLSSRTVRRAV